MLEQSNKANLIMLQNRLVKVMATFDKALDQATEDDVFYVDLLATDLANYCSFSQCLNTQLIVSSS